MGGYTGEKQTYAHHPSGSSRMGKLGPRAGVAGGPKTVLSISRGFWTMSPYIRWHAMGRQKYIQDPTFGALTGGEMLGGVEEGLTQCDISHTLVLCTILFYF